MNMNVLMIEDNPPHARIIEQALRQVGDDIQIQLATDGESAMELLRQENAGTPERPLPDLILLDLQLPAMNGLEVLELIRHDPRTFLIPVVVVSNRDDRESIERCYASGANAYLSKPDNPALLATQLMVLRDFWSRATFPTQLGES
ncbi:MAG: response regulator [Phycisphaeraceae bacterium]|nr:response regulator [Phycisphaeraceae bacterium]